MSTTTAPTTPTVTIRPSTLAEAWATFLESGEYKQTHRENFYDDSDQRGCAWQAFHAMCDRAGIGILARQPLLRSLDSWANTAVGRLGYPSVVEANDRGKTFAEIAAAMREELASAPI